MSNTVIKVEHLYKQYRLGLVGTGSLAHDLNRWWHKVRGKEDPYEKVTVVNNRAEASNDEYVWALKDVNFEVAQGEVLGIIGKNGAGKSTLLKILSKVTGPSKGSIKIKGRIASLLEVGTGFHPELTGRENIFLNGAILGMSKAEIKSKFDEIVDFSGVGKYIDTPVKRYSSGMYVRLAFAVAAHLEPEILIVDEVLAVGDAEFQKKCLGKMKDVSGQGRTILFVSHNMSAIDSLCSRTIIIRNGTVAFSGPTKEGIKNYFDDNLRINEGKAITDFTRDLERYGKLVRIEAMEAKPHIFWRENVELKFSVRKIDKSISELEFGFGINDSSGLRICTFESEKAYSFSNNSDVLTLKVLLTEPRFVPGKYFINLGVRSSTKTLDHVGFGTSFEVAEIDKEGNHFGFTQGASIAGYIDTRGVVEQIT
jgi:lipopolysaccharide transport system ATP-binding protein